MNNRNIFPAQDLILTGERVSYVFSETSWSNDSLTDYISIYRISDSIRRPTIDRIQIQEYRLRPGLSHAQFVQQRRTIRAQSQKVETYRAFKSVGWMHIGASAGNSSWIQIVFKLYSRCDRSYQLTTMATKTDQTTLKALTEKTQELQSLKISLLQQQLSKLQSQKITSLQNQLSDLQIQKIASLKAQIVKLNSKNIKQ